LVSMSVFFSFLEAPPPAGSSTLSLHDALPIFAAALLADEPGRGAIERPGSFSIHSNYMECPGEFQDAYTLSPILEILTDHDTRRSEEHTSELQSRENLVCRLLLEKKKKEDTRA